MVELRKVLPNPADVARQFLQESDFRDLHEQTGGDAVRHVREMRGGRMIGTGRRPLGDRIRQAREQSGVRLRALAAELGISPSYLSDIENGKRTPAHRLLVEICRRLRLDLDELLAAAGKLDPETRRYLRRSPAAARLLRRIARLRLGEGHLRALERQVELLAARKSPRPLESP